MRAVILCGHWYEVPFAYLRAAADSRFEIIRVVFPSHAFYEQRMWRLRGHSGKAPASRLLGLKRALRRRIPTGLVSLIKGRPVADYQGFLKAKNVPFEFCDDINAPRFVAHLRALRPEVILSLSFPQILKKEVLSVPSRSCVNVHPSLLPRYRGPASQFWILSNGEEESGVTAHVMNEDIDDGDIIAQERFSVRGMTRTDLNQRVMAAAPALIGKVEAFFLTGGSRAVPQDRSLASYEPAARAGDVRVRWDWEGQRLHHGLRTEALLTSIRGRTVILGRNDWQPEAEGEGPDAEKFGGTEPGTVLALTEEGIRVAVKGGVIVVREVLFSAESRPVPAARWARRQGLRAGERFG